MEAKRLKGEHVRVGLNIYLESRNASLGGISSPELDKTFLTDRILKEGVINL